jgi:hypothetical protein
VLSRTQPAPARRTAHARPTLHRVSSAASAVLCPRPQRARTSLLMQPVALAKTSSPDALVRNSIWYIGTLGSEGEAGACTLVSKGSPTQRQHFSWRLAFPTRACRRLSRPRECSPSSSCRQRRTLPGHCGTRLRTRPTCPRCTYCVRVHVRGVWWVGLGVGGWREGLGTRRSLSPLSLSLSRARRWSSAAGRQRAPPCLSADACTHTHALSGVRHPTVPAHTNKRLTGPSRR